MPDSARGSGDREMQRLPRSVAAISIRQPWASLLAMGAIDHCRVPSETTHRGLLVIHASGRDDYVSAAAAWNDLLANASVGRTPLVFPLPQAAVIAVGNLVDCVQGPAGWEVWFTDMRRARAPLASPGGFGVWTWRLPDIARQADLWQTVSVGDQHV